MIFLGKVLRFPFWRHRKLISDGPKLLSRNGAITSPRITSLCTALCLQLDSISPGGQTHRLGVITPLTCVNIFPALCFSSPPPSFSACSLLILHKQYDEAVWEIESHIKRCKYFAYKIKYTTRWPRTCLSLGLRNSQGKDVSGRCQIKPNILFLLRTPSSSLAKTKGKVFPASTCTLALNQQRN